ncbi:spore cortex biosynthesis protein YabQ [Virgibacillus halophilus]|uniref:Spore cortex biosynthesis protein YabQ n=1 Tax=Tigheibacillus halophilus TaxID=361280 RepID=A0ABU5C7J7_9BACI|nr:spore cortex biosynthesis protein YabQ [Virgibacillus halophilus]
MQLSVQLTTMAAMVISGIYLGAVRDTFQRMAWHWKQRTIFKYVMEISFWLVQTFVVYYVLFLVNYGELRMYIFLACLLGYAMYQALLAKLYRYVLEMLIKALKAIYRFIYNIIRTFIYIPIRFLVHTLIVCVLFLLQITYTIIRFCLKVVFFPLIWLAKVIYKHLPEKFKKDFPQICRSL